MIKFALVVAALLVTLPPAIAKDNGWRVRNDQVRIDLSDIDANTSSGRAVLLTRVERAAKRLCGDEIVNVIRRSCIRSVLVTTAASPRNASLRLALAENKGLPLSAR